MKKRARAQGGRPSTWLPLAAGALVALTATGCASEFQGKWKGECNVGLGSNGAEVPVEFNIVDTATLIAAQQNPEDYKDLLVRMAGYSDYFNDMNADLQQEVIERTQNEAF